MVKEVEPVIATETKIVHDAAQHIDRKVVAGQQIPPDLVAAYKDGDVIADPVANADVDYDKQSVEELQAEVARRAVEVEGSGADGNVLKKDLVAALKFDDGVQEDAAARAAARDPE